MFAIKENQMIKPKTDEEEKDGYIFQLNSALLFIKKASIPPDYEIHLTGSGKASIVISRTAIVTNY